MLQLIKRKFIPVLENKQKHRVTGSPKTLSPLIFREVEQSSK